MKASSRAPLRAAPLCHPDEASNASGWKDLGQRRGPLCHPDEAATRADGRISDSGTALFCHPDEASNASGRRDLGQLRAREAGSGFALLHTNILLHKAQKFRDELFSLNAFGTDVLHLGYEQPSGHPILTVLARNPATPASCKNNFRRNETTLGSGAVPKPLPMVRTPFAHTINT